MQSQEINPELIRLYYLQQMGIAAYAPRVELAGALAVDAEPWIGSAAEPVVDPGVSTEPAAVREPPVETPPPAQVSAPRPRLVVDDAPAETKPAARAPAKPAAPSTATSDSAAGVQDAVTEAVAPFQLLFAVASSDLALVLQIPALATPALRDAEARLLQNLLRWLGHKLPDSFLSYRWPLPGLPSATAEVAGRSLDVFLQQAAGDRPFTRLLLLGATPSQCLQQHYQHANANWQCWTSHSLAELLALPELKRDTWLQLQSLHAQLLPPA
ncbi:MAG: hypothetical protein V4603_08795 [Pseudomonadota bacterium]